MKNYLDFEKEVKALEQEVDGLKSPFGSEGISEVDTQKIKNTQMPQWPATLVRTSRWVSRPRAARAHEGSGGRDRSSVRRSRRTRKNV